MFKNNSSNENYSKVGYSFRFLQSVGEKMTWMIWEERLENWTLKKEEKRVKIMGKICLRPLQWWEVEPNGSFASSYSSTRCSGDLHCYSSGD